MLSDDDLVSDKLLYPTKSLLKTCDLVKDFMQFSLFIRVFVVSLQRFSEIRD